MAEFRISDDGVVFERIDGQEVEAPRRGQLAQIGGVWRNMNDLLAIPVGGSSTSDSINLPPNMMPDRTPPVDDAPAPTTNDMSNVPILGLVDRIAGPGTVDAVLEENENLGRNLAVGFLSIPATVPMLYGLGRAGYDYAMGNYEGDDAAAVLYREGGYQGAADLAQQYATEYYEANAEQFEQEGLTDEQIDERITEYLSTNAAFLDAQTQFLRPGLMEAQDLMEWAARASGQHHPAMNSVGDDVQQIVGGAVVGAPRALTAAIFAPIRRGIAAIPTRVLRGTVNAAGNVLELATPVTFNASTGRIAANIVVGSAVNDVARTITGDASVLNAVTGETSETGAFTEDAGENLVAAGILGGMFARRAMTVRPPRPPQVDPLPTRVVDAGDEVESVTTTGERAAAHLSDATNAVTGPIRRALGDEIGDIVDSAINTFTGTAAGQLSNMARVHGLLPGTSRTFEMPRLRPLYQARDQLAPERQDELNVYWLARTARQTQEMEAADLREAGDDAGANAVLHRTPLFIRNHPGSRGRSIDTILREGDADPEFGRFVRDTDAIVRTMRQYLNDTGMGMDPALLRALDTQHSHYIPLREDPFRGRTGSDRRPIIWRDRLNRLTGNNPERVPPSAMKNVELLGARRLDADLSYAQDPLDSLNEYIHTVVVATNANRARRVTVNALMGAQDAGRFDGLVIRQAARTTTQQLAQNTHRLGPEILNNLAEYVPVVRGREVTFYQLGDPTMATALQFRAPAFIPVMNEMRRISQFFKTGVGNILRTPVTALYDIGVGSLVAPTTGPGLNPFRAALSVPWNTMRQVAPAAAESLSRSIRDGLFIGNNPLIETLRLLPGGEQQLTDLADWMSRRYLKSHLHLLRMHGYGDMRTLSDPQMTMTASLFDNGLLSNIGAAFHGATAPIRAMQGSIRFGYFVRRMAELRKEHGSDDAIPAATLREVVRDVRGLGADITRTPLSQTMNRVQSTAIYMNVANQSIRTIASFIRRDPVTFGRRFVTYYGLPLIAAAWLNEETPGVTDWIANQPQYMRDTRFFTLQPEVMVRRMMGENVPFDPADMWEIPITPEMIPAVSAFMSGARMLGIVPSYPQYDREFSAAVGEMFGRIVGTTVPGVEAAFAMAGVQFRPDAVFSEAMPLVSGVYTSRERGLHTDFVRPDGVLTHNVASAITALTGGVMSALVDSADRVYVDVVQGDEASDALSEALGYNTTANVRRNNFTTGMFGANRRRTTSTANSQFVSNSMNALENVFGQYSAENDPHGAGRSGASNNVYVPEPGTVGVAVQSPALQGQMEVVYGLLRRGPMNDYNAQRTALLQMYQEVDTTTHQQNDARYERLDELAVQIQEVDRQRAALVLEALEFLREQNDNPDLSFRDWVGMLEADAATFVR